VSAISVRCISFSSQGQRSRSNISKIEWLFGAP